jgi:hypothetical protein
MEELSRAYEDGLVDANSIDWQDLEQALALGPRGALNARSWRDAVITDVRKSMGWMQCFHKEQDYKSRGNTEEDLVEAASSEYTPVPIRSTEPKVGRNQPCPCGSGKKSKKCCGAG